MLSGRVKLAGGGRGWGSLGTPAGDPPAGGFTRRLLARWLPRVCYAEKQPYLTGAKATEAL